MKNGIETVFKTFLKLKPKKDYKIYFAYKRYKQNK